LALIARDKDAAERVNLVADKEYRIGPNRPPSLRDVYKEIALHVITAIELDPDQEAANWRSRFDDAADNKKLLRSLKRAAKTVADANAFWQSKFDALEQKGARKLVKKTGMTYAYNVTVIGATRQVAEEYYKLRQNSRPPEGGFKYLAEKILEACAQL